MKKLSFVAAAALMASTAFAGDHTVNLVGRMSWIDSVNGTTVSDQRIAAEFAKAFFAGKISGNTTYHLTLDLASQGLGKVDSNGNFDPANLKNHGDNTSNLIDEVYVTKTLMEGLTLDLGKRGLLGGGFEITHDTVDQYVQSNYYNVAFQNQFGATLSKEIMGHSLMVQVANGNKERTVGPTATAVASQSRMGWAAEWMGSYGWLKTNVGYTVVPASSKTVTTNLLGVGLQFTLPMAMVLETDYGVVTTKNGINNTVSNPASLADSKVTSIVGTLTWGMNEHVSPFAKLALDTYKDFGSLDSTGASVYTGLSSAKTGDFGAKSHTATTWGLGVELKESKADAIRYHVAYTNTKLAYETLNTIVAGTNKTDSKFYVGAKFDAAILK